MIRGSRLANWLLACALVADDREHVLGDLAEEYAVRGGDTSRLSAQWWYWTQVLRSIPWLLWSPVRRSGWAATLSVAVAACALQAAVELSIALVVPTVFQGGTRGETAITFAVVWGSLVIASWMASRIRPGAGTLLTLMASLAVLARALRSGHEGVHFFDVLESASAPSAALVGAALAVNVRPSRKAADSRSRD